MTDSDDPDTTPPYWCPLHGWSWTGCECPLVVGED